MKIICINYCINKNRLYLCPINNVHHKKFNDASIRKIAKEMQANKGPCAGVEIAPCQYESIWRFSVARKWGGFRSRLEANRRMWKRAAWLAVGRRGCGIKMYGR